MGYMGLSENSAPLHPMVLLIIIPMKNGYFIGGIHHFQTYPYSHEYLRDDGGETQLVAGMFRPSGAGVIKHEST